MTKQGPRTPAISTNPSRLLDSSPEYKRRRNNLIGQLSLSVGDVEKEQWLDLIGRLAAMTIEAATLLTMGEEA
jgi:hypothetical protein